MLMIKDVKPVTGSKRGHPCIRLYKYFLQFTSPVVIILARRSSPSQFTVAHHYFVVMTVKVLPSS